MRNETEDHCVYFFYSVLIDRAHDTSLVWFPFKVDKKLNLRLSGHHLLNCC